MIRKSSWLSGPAIAALGLAVAGAACSDNNSITAAISPLNRYKQTNLVADAAGSGATTIDANLVNPWGVAFGATGVLWVSNNGTGTSTLYDGAGVKKTLTVAIPSATPPASGVPTGVVFNPTTDFVIPGSTAAQFLFAAEDGTITAWNSTTASAATVVASRAANGAVYKGIALGTNAGANVLYATDFKNAHVDMYDKNFAFVKSFTDAGVPAGYAPFGITYVGGGQIFVTFAKQLAPDNHDDQPGAGNGFVDVFNGDGTLARRFASNGDLNSPWGVAVAPATFGAFGGDILIGNFGDGRILAYDATSGAFLDVLRDTNAAPIVIDGLWGLTLGPAASTLYFSAGPGGEAHGLIGTLTLP